MKKNVLLAAALMTSVFAVAQEASSSEEVLNRKGHPVLPKAGDIALGFNAFPVIDFLSEAAKIGSNRGNPAANSTVAYTQNANNNIVGKYFLDDKTAIRVRFGLNSLSTTDRNLVLDSKAIFDAEKGTQEEQIEASLLRVEDTRYQKTNNFTIAAGYEKRRGYRRLVGVYGAELGFSRQNSKASYVYANDFSDMYTTHFTTGGGFNTQSTQNQNAGTTTRINSEKTQGQWAFGVRGFVGIEYFMFSKISIAAEYGFGYSFGATKRLTRTQESYIQSSTGAAVVKQEDIDIASPDASRGFGVDNGIGSIFNKSTIGGSSASLSLLFHF